MLILPAIDLRAGRCVRLKQGDYNQETVFGDDPVAIARRFVEMGAEALHLVDLDGARAGHPVNGESVRKIVEAARVPCQLGGGLRTEAHIDEAFSWGVERVVVGTRVLQDPELFRNLVLDRPWRIVLGLDARDGRVATHGWFNTSEVSALDMARRFEDWPLAGIVFTDIARDGMLTGPNIPALVDLSRAVEIPVIASGGISTLEHVVDLRDHGLVGCIIGRALYEGQLDLSAVLAVAKGKPGSGPFPGLGEF
jgi:phosphoribosylformimino-5-aminoimidazole carboxamide ribotide isomerase